MAGQIQTVTTEPFAAKTSCDAPFVMAVAPGAADSLSQIGKDPIPPWRAFLVTRQVTTATMPAMADEEGVNLQGDCVSPETRDLLERL